MTNTPPEAVEPDAKASGRVVAPWMRSAVDYLGPAAFLIGYLVHKDILSATWWLVGGSVVGLVVAYVLERRVAILPAVWGGAALLFGVMTVVLHDPRIIKVKPTVINFALGMAMIGGLWLKRNPLKALIGDALKLSEEGWRRLTLRYGIFFFAMSALNEVVWRTQPEAVWVAFRWPGLLILAMLFALTQVPTMLKEAKAAEAGAALTELEE